jgi:hypothetical protein
LLLSVFLPVETLPATQVPFNYTKVFVAMDEDDSRHLCINANAPIILAVRPLPPEYANFPVDNIWHCVLTRRGTGGNTVKYHNE